ncbi:DNA-directed DNA polymerase [Tanacetum coccineum]
MENRLSTGSITTWDLLKNAFLSRYRLLSQIIRQTKAIKNFGQECNEPLHLAWERFNDLLYNCPEHKINEHEQLQIFYQGLDPKTRKKADFMGPIPIMTPAAGIKAIDELSKHSLNPGIKKRNTRKMILTKYSNISTILKTTLVFLTRKYEWCNTSTKLQMMKGILFLEKPKGKGSEASKIILNEQCSAVVLNKVPPKEKDPGGALKPTQMCIELAIKTTQFPKGIAENVVVPKKGGTTMITNKDNELIPTRTVTGWRVCIDYRKLKDATRKYHFPLPFIDQMLERLSEKEYYCFLDGFSGYFQIPLAPEDQEKTTFTCPYGTCEETNLVLNWEKCHFMVKEGIVLGHKISKAGIEVDKAKVDVIASLPYPTNIKGIQSFLVHGGFYRRFIKDFSKIARPMTQLLMKDAKFDFSDECIKSFDILRDKLITAPVIIAPNWDLDFKLMCDASDYAVEAVLGQKIEKNFAQFIMQEFTIEIKDKKGTENVAVDHLSRHENPGLEELNEDTIQDNFPDEHLMVIKLKNTETGHDMEMRIEQYIQMIDYALWEVIENGATLPKTTIVEGVMTEMPITTTEEKAQKIGGES